MLFTSRSRKSLFKIFKFLLFGGSGFATNILILYLLTDIFKIWYLASSVISFIISVCLSFVLHKFFTFGNHSLDGLHWQGGIFFTLAVFNLLANTLIMYIGVTILSLNHLITQVLASGLIAVWTFFSLNYLFRFRDQISITTVDN